MLPDEECIYPPPVLRKDIMKLQLFMGCFARKKVRHDSTNSSNGNSHAAALDQHSGDVGGGVVGHGLEVDHKVGADFFEGAKAFFVISAPIQDVPGFVMELSVALELLFQICLQFFVFRDLKQHGNYRSREKASSVRK